MDSSEELLRAISAANAGRRGEAESILRHVVKADARNVLAWFWLSEVAESVEDQIVALETALSFSSNNPRAMERLTQLYEKQDSVVKAQREKLLENARLAHTDGRKEDARGILLQVVNEVANNAPAWQMLGEIIDEPEEQIIALQNALKADPKNPRARMRLALLTKFKNDLIVLGDVYRDEGQLDHSAMAYRLAAARSTSAYRRAQAEQRLADVERLKGIPNFKRFNHTLTMMRLMMGPPLLYVLLMLMMGGFNPFLVSPYWYMAGVSVWVGSVLVAGVAAPRHRVWKILFGVEALSMPMMRAMASSLGIGLIIVPYGLLIGAAAMRLLRFFY